MSNFKVVLQVVLDYYDVLFLYLFMITCKSIETSLNAPSTCILLLLVSGDLSNFVKNCARICLSVCPLVYLSCIAILQSSMARTCNRLFNPDEDC